MFANKSQTGALREIAFQHRSGIDIPQGARPFPAELIHEGGQEFQTLTEGIVVIDEASVTGNETSIQGAVFSVQLGSGRVGGGMCFRAGSGSLLNTEY